jgi:hypothetical protein
MYDAVSDLGKPIDWRTRQALFSRRYIECAYLNNTLR